MALAAAQARERLKAGNERFCEMRAHPADISAEFIEKLATEGQSPYACIVTCSDSRVVPEHIFSAGLGELFCIRVAGNAIGAMELASCAYAAEHLDVKLIVVLGHTKCGAVASALQAAQARPAPAPAEDTEPGGALSPLLEAVADAIGNEHDPRRASIANARAGANALLADAEIAHMAAAGGLEVASALYITETGQVEWL